MYTKIQQTFTYNLKALKALLYISGRYANLWYLDISWELTSTKPNGFSFFQIPFAHDTYTNIYVFFFFCMCYTNKPQFKPNI